MIAAAAGNRQPNVIGYPRPECPPLEKVMRRLSWPYVVGVAFALLLVVVLRDALGPSQLPPHTQTITPGGRSEFLFCLWNAENLFDDRDDGRKGPGDRDYDPLYAERPALLKQKLAKLTDALLTLNDGKGPDILAIVEVEGVRAAELLKEALNARLADPAWHYQHLLMKEVASGRHIAPAIITRLPVRADRTRSLASRLRIVQGHIEVGGKELVVIASHWTSRLQEGDEGRTNYADKIYGACNAMYLSNPAVDFLVCGDFNDTPQDDSVTRHLHSTADPRAARSGPPLQLFNPLAAKDPEQFGTHYYRRWFIFDQVLVSPGMLDDAGWSYAPESVQVINTLTKPGDRLKRPWRFGSENEKGPRGYSDHFPVTARLRVRGDGEAR